MAYSLSPTILTPISEATTFTHTVNIQLADLDPAITSLVVTPAANVGGILNITNNLTLDPAAALDANTFVISGQYKNNFISSLKYLDKSKVETTITSKTTFQELPPEYFTVVEYLASTEPSFTAVFSVQINGNIIGNVTQQVNNNWTPGKESLISAVAGGKV